MMRKYIIILGLILTGQALAQNLQNNGRNYAAACTSCHGTEGLSVSTAVAGLAGMSETYLRAQMRAYKEGTRPSTIMQQIAKGYSDEQVALIAQYFALQSGQYKTYPQK